MVHIDAGNAKNRELVEQAWEKTVSLSRRVIQHTKIYGFNLMELPDPDVHKLYDSLSVTVLPILEKIVADSNIQPDDGMKIDNIRQYILHLRKIVVSIDDDDQEAFNSAVDELNSEAML